MVFVYNLVTTQEQPAYMKIIEKAKEDGIISEGEAKVLEEELEKLKQKGLPEQNLNNLAQALVTKDKTTDERLALIYTLSNILNFYGHVPNKKEITIRITRNGFEIRIERKGWLHGGDDITIEAKKEGKKWVIDIEGNKVISNVPLILVVEENENYYLLVRGTGEVLVPGPGQAPTTHEAPTILAVNQDAYDYNVSESTSSDLSKYKKFSSLHQGKLKKYEEWRNPKIQRMQQEESHEEEEEDEDHPTPQHANRISLNQQVEYFWNGKYNDILKKAGLTREEIDTFFKAVEEGKYGKAIEELITFILRNCGVTSYSLKFVAKLIKEAKLKEGDNAEKVYKKLVKVLKKKHSYAFRGYKVDFEVKKESGKWVLKATARKGRVVKTNTLVLKFYKEGEETAPPPSVTELSDEEKKKIAEAIKNGKKKGKLITFEYDGKTYSIPSQVGDLIIKGKVNIEKMKDGSLSFRWSQSGLEGVSYYLVLPPDNKEGVIFQVMGVNSDRLAGLTSSSIIKLNALVNILEPLAQKRGVTFAIFQKKGDKKPSLTVAIPKGAKTINISFRKVGGKAGWQPVVYYQKDGSVVEAMPKPDGNTEYTSYSLQIDSSVYLGADGKVYIRNKEGKWIEASKVLPEDAATALIEWMKKKGNAGKWNMSRIILLKGKKGYKAILIKKEKIASAGVIGVYTYKSLELRIKKEKGKSKIEETEIVTTFQKTKVGEETDTTQQQQQQQETLLDKITKIRNGLAKVSYGAMILGGVLGLLGIATAPVWSVVFTITSIIAAISMILSLIGQIKYIKDNFERLKKEGKLTEAYLTLARDVAIAALFGLNALSFIGIKLPYGLYRFAGKTSSLAMYLLMLYSLVKPKTTTKGKGK